LGGFAGGLDAYKRLLRHLPADLGVAVVIANHLRTTATAGEPDMPASAIDSGCIDDILSPENIQESLEITLANPTEQPTQRS
jgi:chemotaxis response regulator CheB